MSTFSSPTPSDASRCPHCGSSLGGVESATCPHCGRLLPKKPATPSPRPAAPQPKPPASSAPPPQAPQVAPPTASPEAEGGPSVVHQSDPTVLTPEEKARLRQKVRIVVASFSALILLLTYLVLLQLSK